MLCYWSLRQNTRRWVAGVGKSSGDQSALLYDQWRQRFPWELHICGLLNAVIQGKKAAREHAGSIRPTPLWSASWAIRLVIINTKETWAPLAQGIGLRRRPGPHESKWPNLSLPQFPYPRNLSNRSTQLTEIKGLNELKHLKQLKQLKTLSYCSVLVTIIIGQN